MCRIADPSNTGCLVASLYNATDCGPAKEKERKRDSKQRAQKVTSKYAEHLRTSMASATGTQQERMAHANKTWVEQRQQTNPNAWASNKAVL